jgi:BspA type Leucine rich repeat region (6 copies)
MTGIHETERLCTFVSLAPKILLFLLIKQRIYLRIGDYMKRWIVTFLVLLTITSSSLTQANAEVVTFPCTGGTYSVEMPAASIKKDNGCTGNLVIDPSIKSIGDNAFQFSKINTVSIPNSVTTIGSSAFEYSALTSVVIPNSVTSMSRSAFASSKIKSVEISTALTTISDSAFSFTSNLTSVVIPKGVQTIGANAFWLSGITSVTIPNSVTSIGRSAFSSTKLVKVDIPDSVKSIDYGAFGFNPSLTSITYCGAQGDLPTAPTCPADRKAIIDAAAKAAADKAAADKAAADAKAAAEKAAADAKAAVDRAAAEAKAAADRAAAEARAAADRAATQAAQDAKKLTITCTKGKTSKKVTGESPVCPKGFTNSMGKYLTFQAYSKCRLYKKNSPIAGISLLDAGQTLKFSYTGKYSSYMASAASYADVSCTLSVMKAPSFVTSQIDTTRALDGLQRATWGKNSAFWTYHPDNGLNISFNSK